MRRAVYGRWCGGYVRRVPGTVTMIVVSYNTRETTLACLASLLADVPAGGEVVLVDNASADSTAAAVLVEHPAVRVLAQEQNLGFARACNLAARGARTDHLGFVNSDCLVRPGCLQRLAGFLDVHADAAIAVPRLVDEHGNVQHNVTRLPTAGSLALEYLAGHIRGGYDLDGVRESLAVESCSGAALLIRRSDFEAAGGFHEGYFMYVEDVELSRRIGELGRRIYYLPDAVVFHEEGASSHAEKPRLTEMLHRNREDYVRRTMPAATARATLAAMRVGRRVAPLRDRALARLRGVS